MLTSNVTDGAVLEIGMFADRRVGRSLCEI